ncbi:MAG: hypothetical protein MI919_40120 [Holophagales bacterium]|nr:hypothetical protein [Holophagales bacterium]
MTARHPVPRDRRAWSTALARGLVIWIVPVSVVWLLAVPFYNPFLAKAAENLVRLTEDPAVTRLPMQGEDHFLVTRTDYSTAKGFLSSVRITDTHFPLILTGVLFLAVPGVTLRKRLEYLGWATLISAFFHIFSLLLWVKFIYATQLGSWSAEMYSPFAQNAWGLAKHLIDLPFKFGMPLLLWAAFFLRELIPRAPRRAAERPAQ